jgi:hypothetical protein
VPVRLHDETAELAARVFELFANTEEHVGSTGSRDEAPDLEIV